MVANSLFITGTEPMWIWSKKLAKRNGQGSNGKQTDGNTSRVKSQTHTVKIRKNLDNGNKGNHCTRKKIVTASVED